MAKEK
jgi:FtsZ-binding cell division protein ZapB